MDKSMWQTSGAFDLVHSSHKWTQAILFCGKHSTTMQTLIISRLWFCRRRRRININIRRSSVHFRESHVCANKLDVQEANFSFTQLYLSVNNFFRCRLTHGWDALTLWEFDDWTMSFRTEQDWTTQGRAPKRPVAGNQAKHTQTHPIQAHQRHFNWHWSHSIQRNAFWCWSHAVCLWGQWLRWPSTIEAPQWDMFHGPTELLWIG